MLRRPPRTKPHRVTPRSSRELDGERGRRADRDEQRAAGDRGLLHELERQPAADAEHRPRRAAAGPRRTPSRPPCPSRCAARRPRAGRAASPRSSKRPVACRPPVASNAGCASRSRSGSPARSAAGSRQLALDPGRLDRDRLERALAADTARRRRVEAARRAAPDRSRARPARPCSPRGRRAGGRRAGRSPSESAKPIASSSSWPGVRIVTATGVPPIRISSGSSTATTSLGLAARDADDLHPGGRIRRHGHEPSILAACRWWSSAPARASTRSRGASRRARP